MRFFFVRETRRGARKKIKLSLLAVGAYRRYSLFMRHLYIMTCLCFATACAGPRAASLHVTNPVSTEAEGMQISHSEPDAPHCFTSHDHRLICPEGRRRDLQRQRCRSASHPSDDGA